jgi:hypothetical protein
MSRVLFVILACGAPPGGINYTRMHHVVSKKHGVNWIIFNEVVDAS